MAGSPAPSGGRVFISYRREETAYAAGWLFDRLADHLGRGQIFKDVNSIQLGDDFVEVISRAVASCDVLLALIGDRWLTIADDEGRTRLQDPNDFVRLEIEAALTRNVRVIPILVEGARMPRVDEVPASLAMLVRRQALQLSPTDFDTSRLLKVLDISLADAPPKSDAPEESVDEVKPHMEASEKTTRKRRDEEPDRQQARRRRILIAAGVSAVVLAAGLTAGLVLAGGGGTGSTARTVDVPATQAWTDTGVACTTGALFEITATGTILHNNTVANSAVGPEGDPDVSLRQFNVSGLPDVNHAALIGSIDRAQPSFVGKQTTFHCTRAGELFLGINDSGLNNNSGMFTATIKRR